MLRTLSLFFALLLVFSASATAQQAMRTLELETSLEMETVSNPQIAPDGSQIIYTRGWVDKVNDSRESSLWIMNADGSKNRHLVEGSNASWSPDGTRIVYTTKGEPRGTQIFVRWMDDEGAVTQITRLEERPSGIRWSPDGGWIAFTMMVPSEEAWKVKLPGKPEGAKWTKSPRVIDRLYYRRDRVGYLEDGYRHIFILPAEGGTPRQITSGDYHHGGGFNSGNLEWTPDGEYIVFSGLRQEDAEYQWRESEIYAVRLTDGAITQLTDRHGPDSSPLVSPDGRRIVYRGYDWSDDTYVTPELYLMDRDGSNARMISGDFDRRVRGMMWAPDGKGVYLNVGTEGTRQLYYASLDGKVRPVTEGQQMLTVTDISDGGQAVAVRTTFHEPPDVWTFPLKHPERMKQLTRVNADVLAGVTLGEVEEIWYNSVDDYRIQGWIVKPPDFDHNKKYPLILQIHGGPHGMYNVAFSFSRQDHAANGYVVLYTNPRGSAGYGAEFGNAIKRAYPGKDYDDLMNGVDEMIARGYIDENRMSVFGCSGGGVLTSWVVGHTNRFAAASANCPVINWLSFVGTTDGASWYRNFDHFPWDDPSEHLRRSPLMYVGNVTTPTMLMTGVNDLRTPISQTEEYYMALKVRKIPTVMLRFNDEWHGTSRKPSNFMRTQLYLRGWFEKHTPTDEATVTAAGGDE